MQEILILSNVTFLSSLNYTILIKRMCVCVCVFVWKNEVIFFNEVGTKPIKTILNVLMKEKKRENKKKMLK